MSFLKNFINEEDGQDMVEYGLIIALVVLGAVIAFTHFGTQVAAGVTTQGDSAKTVLDTNIQ